MAAFPPLAAALADPARPVFLFGCTPPQEGTTEARAREICARFAARSAVLATDGFVVYDLQDEGVRTSEPRPFPFRRTMDSSLFASFFKPVSGKDCVVYKCATDSSAEAFDAWLSRATTEHGHQCFNLVGAPSSRAPGTGLSLADAMRTAAARASASGAAPVNFGCVCIAERHTAKGTEHDAMAAKAAAGAGWFITQGIFDAAPMAALLRAYGDRCRATGERPRKVLLTFTPVGKPKTLAFIKWLGMAVPSAVEARIMAAASPVRESVRVLEETLVSLLAAAAGAGVPLGLNVESVSNVAEEIDAAHDLFRVLQAAMLNAAGSPWAVRWHWVAETALAGAAGAAALAALAAAGGAASSSSSSATAPTSEPRRLEN